MKSERELNEARMNELMNACTKVNWTNEQIQFYSGHRGRFSLATSKWQSALILMREKSIGELRHLTCFTNNRETKIELLKMFHQ